MHPVLQSVQEHNIGHLVSEGPHSLEYLWFFGKKGEYSLTTFDVNKATDFVDVAVEIKMRCKVATVRNKLYLRALTGWLPRSFTVSYREPRTLFLEGTFADAEVSEQDLLLRLLVLNDLSYTLVLATHINTRLSEQSSRRGSLVFKKVLPSYLAALTVCSIQEGIEAN